jgi:hypothetical protein
LIGNEVNADILHPELHPEWFPHVSTGCTVIITNIEIDQGTYLLEVGRPEIDPEATLAAPYPSNITISANGTTETVYVHLKNIAGAYGFGFVLTYDPDWKTTDVQHITILPPFAPPFESLHMTVDDVNGVITFELMKPSEKPTICSKDIAVVKIDFVAILSPEDNLIPFPHDGTFAITEAWVNIKNATWTGVYDFIESDAIKAAADRLVALQSTTDYGWDWDVTGLTSHSGSASAPNLYGVTALDLIHAYELTGNSTYLAAAESAANELMFGNTSDWGTYATLGYGTGRWGYSFDYEFLMHLYVATGDSSYSTYAKAAWTWQKANIPRFADPTTLWNFYVGYGYGTAAWQGGDWGLATYLLGDTTFAQGIAGHIHTDIANIELADNMGMGEALNFLATAYPATYAVDINTLKTKLLVNQLLNGAWGFQSTTLPEDVQTTAYCVMGLVAAGEFAAAQKGADWLVDDQLPNGGWYWDTANNVEYSEIDSEAMSALIAATGYSGDLGNLFRPKSLADLNFDGVVDIADLAKVAKQYGNAVDYAKLADLKSGKVDIFDIVFVAKRFGDP